jgi:choline dehydrogenase-like flavoprotein
MEGVDIVIVGAGSAGCVLAHRLSHAKIGSVCLLEAGGADDHPAVRVPLAFSRLFRSARDWALQSEPEPHLDGRALFIPRGKMLGGSSSLNAMIYIRGRTSDYDGWGCDGWSWREVLPWFVKAEANARLGAPLHGRDGPLVVQDPRNASPISRAFVEAAVAHGHPRNDDFNGATQLGAGLYQLTQKRGRRWSTADAYLRAADPRLRTVTDVNVSRVIVERGRAVAVEYVREGRAERIAVGRELVLAAGAIGSPAILLRSGIGPADELRALGIDVVHELPGVGANLQDHPVVPIAYVCTQPITLARAEHWTNVARWLLLRSGPLTSNVAEAGLFVGSGCGLVEPDLQFHVAPVWFVEHGFRQPPGHGFTMGPTLLSPTSRGRVSLRSSDPADAPRIEVGALGDPAERAALRFGIRLARALARTEPLASFAAEEHLPGASHDSDAELDAHIRRYTELLYHPVGTCKMGTGDDAVVDAALRVRGIEGLRVIDASIMPTIVGGNTNAPTIMIAEKGAELIAGS